jgi:hypothetical protein
VNPLLLAKITSANHQPIGLPVNTDGASNAVSENEKMLNTSHVPQRMALESFRFLMDQVPAIRTIEFSSKDHHDPLESKDLVKMVDYANKFNGTESTIYTNGLLLKPFTDELLKSRLHALVIRIHAHRPSLYTLLSGQPLTQFVIILDNLRYLLQRKHELKSLLEIELCMMVDIHHYKQIPEMIRFAEELGVDGIRFENYLTPNSNQKSDRTLFSHQTNVKQFLTELQNTILKTSRLLVTLPVLLDMDMSEHRHCLEAYGTVSVDAEFNVSGCSRQLLIPEQASKIWEEDFFNNSMYQWLRSIHNVQSPPSNNTSKAEVPLPCQNCPRNMQKH